MPDFVLHRIALVCAIVFAANLGCSRLVRPPGAPKTKAKLVVVKVEIEGVQALDKEELLEGLALRPPYGFLTRTSTLFDATSMELDRRRIETFYRGRGYFDARVVKMEKRNISVTKVAVHFVVEEGEPTLLTRLTFQQGQDDRYPEQELLATLAMKTGTVLVYEDYEEGQKRLVRYLAGRGHAFARVNGQVLVDAKGHQADIIYKIDPGPKVRFGHTSIRGANRVPHDAIRARFRYRAGERFSPEKLRETRNELYAMGLLSSVQYDYDRNAVDSVTDLELQVREGSRNEVKAGPGVGIDNARYETRLRVEYERKGVLLPLATLRVEAKPRLSYFKATTTDTPFGGEATASLAFLDVPARFFTLKTTGGYSVDDFTAYSGRGPKASVSLGREFLDKRLQLSTGWNWHYQTLSRIDGRLSDEERKSVGLASPYMVGSLFQRVTYDGRDRPLAATRGLYMQLELEEGGRYSASDFEYVRATPEVRAYWAPSESIVAAARLQLGATLQVGNLLPISQRYFAGGSASHRGFSIQRLSPRGGGGRVPIGGEALINSSLELRYASAWFDRLDLITFLDGADVTNSPGELDPSNLHWATGMGLRVRTPVGPVRLDVGYRLNRKQDINDDSWAWHLGLGEAF